MNNDGGDCWLYNKGFTMSVATGHTITRYLTYTHHYNTRLWYTKLIDTPIDKY
jgi:hypothetical protein